MRRGDTTAARIVVLFFSFSFWLVHPAQSATTSTLRVRRRGEPPQERPERRAQEGQHLLTADDADADDDDDDDVNNSNRQCPANQQYLPEVQYGCPASCDQPVPQCQAAIGPGCGCPNGTVIAGSYTNINFIISNNNNNSSSSNSRPAAARYYNHHRRRRRPEHCITPRQCHNRPRHRQHHRPTAMNTTSCTVLGCNGEICTVTGDDLFTICIVPTCQVSCRTKYGICTTPITTTTTTSGNGENGSSCGWDTSAAEQNYQECLMGCTREGHEY